MQKPIAAAAILSFAIVISGCKPKVDESAAATAPAPATSSAPAEAAAKPAPGKLPKFATPSRIAEIKSSGQTGFWANPAEFCPGKRVTVLTWNIEASGAQKVIVYVVDKDGKERHFGRGGPVGERQTGPWLQPGLTFKLRNADGGAELGSITFARGKSC